MRVTQTWICTWCGHRRSQEISYPKYGASETPLVDLAAAGFCTRCRARGHCVIEEDGRLFGSTAALEELRAGPRVATPQADGEANLLVLRGRRRR